MSVEYSTFSYVTAANSKLYRAVMLEFMRAKDRFIVHLRPEEVVATLGTDETEVRSALKQLSDWGNLSADPDTTRVTTVEDFHRARYVYQMTAKGESAERALRQFDESIGRSGSLQAAALADIRESLRALLQLARHEDRDAGKVHPLLLNLVSRFQGLADNAQAFVGSLQRTIDLNGIDTDAFLAYKDQLIQYLERFVRDLIATGSDIARLIEEIEDAGVDELLTLAADREANDEAPGASVDSGLAERTTAIWQQRWQGFRDWFVGSPTHESQSRLLRGRARTAISQLLQVVMVLNERRSGRSDRSADFRQLALWFAEAPDDRSLHSLARVAFGLSPSRHLTIDAQTLADRQQSPVAPSTPWADAPALSISPRLRATGRYERTGKPTQVRDRSAARQLLAETAARRDRDLEAVRAQLFTLEPTMLSGFERLDPAAFEYLLRVVGDALSNRRANEPMTVRSLDGSLSIRLTPAQSTGPQHPLVELTTTDGTLRGPEHRFEILAARGTE